MVIEVKETVPIDLDKRVIPQLIYEIVLVSASKGTAEGTRYLAFAVVCEDYTFHSFAVTMTECWSFDQAAQTPVMNRYSLSLGVCFLFGKRRRSLEEVRGNWGEAEMAY